MVATFSPRGRGARASMSARRREHGAHGDLVAAQHATPLPRLSTSRHPWSADHTGADVMAAAVGCRS